MTILNDRKVLEHMQESNNLIVKDVPFCNAELLAVQDKKTGKIYAGINSILRELGFNESQIRYRRDKWVDDKSVSKGVRKFLHPSINGGSQETYCIDIKKLPIALAKIEITPRMESNMPELSEKLEKYQDECADILADAFISKQEKMILPKDFPSALRAYADEYEKNMLLEQKNDTLNKENDLLSQKTLEWADRPIINALVRAYGHYLDDYAEAWKNFKKELLYRYRINLNARKTAYLNNGGSKKRGTLDFISDDELPQAISTAVALCREYNIDISDIIQKKAS